MAPLPSPAPLLLLGLGGCAAGGQARLGGRPRALRPHHPRAGGQQRHGRHGGRQRCGGSLPALPLAPLCSRPPTSASTACSLPSPPRPAVDLALRASVFGAVGTAGQRCTSLRRLIIHESVYDAFVARMVKVGGRGGHERILAPPTRPPPLPLLPRRRTRPSRSATRSRPARSWAPCIRPPPSRSSPTDSLRSRSRCVARAAPRRSRRSGASGGKIAALV